MATSSRFSGWPMVALALLAQNAGLGLFYGSFGAVLGGLEQQAGLSRVQSASGLTAVLVLMALSSAWAGAALATRPVRWAMAGGLVLGAAAYATLALAHSYPVFLLACAMAGTTIGIASIICPFLVISRWFKAKRGMALGLGNIPILLSAAPLVIAAALPVVGLHPVLWGEAGICLFAAALIALFLVERPADLGQSPLGGDGPVDPVNAHPTSGRSYAFLADWRFWTLAFGLGVLNGSANVFFAHIFPYATETGHTLKDGSNLASLYGLAGIIGVPLAGWLADRIGASAVVALMCAIAAAFFETLALHMDMAVIFVFCAAFGAFLSGIAASQGSSVCELFRPDQIGPITGVIFLAQLPIMAGAPPLVGKLRVMNGDYTAAFHLMALVCVGAALLVLFTALQHRRQRRG